MMYSIELRVDPQCTGARWACRGALSLLLMFIGLVAACGDRADSDLWTATQCFKPLADESYPRRDELFQDEKRGCWGQRWAIPKKHSPHMQANLTNAETIILYLDAMAVFDSEKAKPPRKERAWEHRVEVTGITHAGFEVQRNRIRKLQEHWPNGRKRTGRFLFEFEVYDDGNKSEFRYFYLFSEKIKNLYVSCLLPTNKDVEDMQPWWTCNVFTHMDQKFDVSYIVPYAAMKDLGSINVEVQNHLKNFMLEN